jgi:hypothetical protein
MLVEVCLSLRCHFTGKLHYIISGIKLLELPFCQNCGYEGYDLDCRDICNNCFRSLKSLFDEKLYEFMLLKNHEKLS